MKVIFFQGAGTMGSGIAQVSAQAGLEVILMDLSAEFIQRGMNSIKKSLQRSVDKFWRYGVFMISASGFLFSVFGRRILHPRPQDGVFRCALNKLVIDFLG